LVNSGVWGLDGPRVLHLLLLVVENKLVSIELQVILLDNIVIGLELLAGSIHDLVLPNLLNLVEVTERLLDGLGVRILSCSSQVFFNICEGVSNDVYKEVVHEVSVVTLKGNSGRLSCHWIEGNTSIKLNGSFLLIFLLFHEFLFIFFQVFWGKLTGLVISHEDLEIVEEFDIHLNVVQNVKVASC
jgi:hypothetical protein